MNPVYCVTRPAKVPFFDDASSYGHGVLGTVSAYLPDAWAATIALGYVFYQMNEVEQLPNKIGDLAEFAVGFLAGKALKQAA
jgi:hypothetical protein